MPRYLPGNPTIVLQLMPGAGGTKANNYFQNVAPKDGSVIMSLHADSVQTQLLRATGIKYDASKFVGVGQFTDQNSAIAVWHKAPATSFDGVRKTEVILGATGKGSYQYQLPMVMNAVLGTKFKVITGYRGTRKQDLAMESGEIHGRTGSIASWASGRPEWLKAGKLAFIAQVGVNRSAEFRKVPLVTELAPTDEGRRMLQLVSSGSVLGRSVVTTPGIPADRLAALRAAFDRAVADPALRAYCAKRKIALNPKSGKELQRLLAEARDVPPQVVARVKAVLKLK
jgi:tripartite-type tricarboxylate transporter receptor subunit TctC